MNLLALDTAGKTASCALCVDGVVIAQEQRDSMLDHSRTLLVLCQEMLDHQGAALEDMDAFACTVGPGSFTGIRIGAAAVKGFGWAADKPCAGVSTLLAMAYGAGADGIFCCRVTARETEYYYAFFAVEQGRVMRLTEDDIAPWSQIEARLVQWPGCRILTDCHDAAGAALAAWDMARANLLVSCHDIVPVYLRRPQAERLREERLRREATDQT